MTGIVHFCILFPFLRVNKILKMGAIPIDPIAARGFTRCDSKDRQRSATLVAFTTDGITVGRNIAGSFVSGVLRGMPTVDPAGASSQQRHDLKKWNANQPSKSSRGRGRIPRQHRDIFRVFHMRPGVARRRENGARIFHTSPRITSVASRRCSPASTRRCEGFVDSAK
jgi:hypothetical protein